MTPINHYILLFFCLVTWLLPVVTKAAEQSDVNITPSPTITNKSWHLYPCSIQLRSGLMVHKTIDRFRADPIKPLPNEKVIVVIPTTIDLDSLYVHSFFASQLASYPRIGLSFLLPYAFQKAPPFRFPNIWGMLAYMELYRSHPTLSTWGNRMSIGAIKGGTLVQTKSSPPYSFVAIKEINYHWLCAPSLQLNFGMGLLINWWTKNKQNQQKANQASGTDPPQVDKPLLSYTSNENNAVKLKFAPIITIGIRYITHTEPFLSLLNKQICYRKPKRSRIDCSIAGNSRRLASNQKYYLIFRGTALVSFAINTHNALLCAIELGYNRYKKIWLKDMLSVGAMEVTTLLGYEIRYGRCLLQLQLGCEITDLQKPTVQTIHENSLTDLLNRQGSFSVNIQYMLTEHFFVGMGTRFQELPALRLGMSW